jgi:hypothetical protein
MTIFDSTPGRGRVVGGGGRSGLIGLGGLGIAALVILILLFNSVTRVGLDAWVFSLCSEG